MRIACIGNAVYDYTVSSDKFLMEGVKTSFYNPVFSAGGPASTAASVIAKFGNEVDFYGKIGNDVQGKFVYNKMLSEGIDLRHLVVSNQATTPFSFVMLNTSNSTRTIATVRDKDDFNNPTIGIDDFETDYDYILTDGKYIEDTIMLIKENPQARTIIDAGRVNDGVLKLCSIVDYIICSQDFAEEVTNMIISDNYRDIVMVFNKMETIFPYAKEITITIGSRGYICKENDEVVVKPAYQSGLPVVDTNCAGDIYHGAFTYAIANGYEYHDALEFANTTASLSTAKTGGRDSVPELIDVENALQRQNKILVKKLVK